MSETKDNFTDLKRLLKLKRHEIPPPGYFHHFSGDVLSRIRAGETGGGEGVIGRLQSGSPWVLEVLRALQGKPGLLGALAASLCLLLVLGVFLADRSEGGAEADVAVAPSPVNPTPALASAGNLVPADNGIALNTNPVVSLQAASTLFGSAQSDQNPLFQSASFAPSAQ
jgi:hypothetical protein